MKTRLFHTKFWHDSYITELSPHEKLFFNYLLTNPFVNICGIYELPDRYMCADLALDLAEIQQMKDKFQKDNKFTFFDGWVKINNVDRYQSYTGELNNKAKEKELDLVPDKLRGIDTVSDSVSIQYLRGIDTHGILQEIRNKKQELTCNSSKEVTSLKGSNIVTTAPGNKDSPDQDTRIKKHGNAHARKIEYLMNLPEEDLNRFVKRFGLTGDKIKTEAEMAFHWLKSKGRQHTDYEEYFCTWLLRIKQREKEKEAKPYNPFNPNIKFNRPPKEIVS